MSLDRTRRVGFQTSGGDAPGMNAAIRAITRPALQSYINTLMAKKPTLAVAGKVQGLDEVLEGESALAQSLSTIKPMTASALLR